ncbi:predicted protein [Sclerotinia sclerotiorum 1980 UF-70]|uniref:Uncharacterized protein n=1 Tax=Sclerotinia sclerotiorum (strain ATCC 18683 / 1980 / Ss-1) TaxID=665079 RepID=A7EID3_SCLS1|nr:predicted protein [Sclerotinia sclerotiorum 1980 UF-70]EDO02599.1 predicted protein [Sclerotinia sclerotiorum 1980 UF-70]
MARIGKQRYMRTCVAHEIFCTSETEVNKLISLVENVRLQILQKEFPWKSPW